jgi:hypothetical protein
VEVFLFHPVLVPFLFDLLGRVAGGEVGHI